MTKQLIRIKIVGTLFSILTIFSFLGVIFSRKSSLAKTCGEVESKSSKTRYTKKFFYSFTTFKLKGSTKKFVVRERSYANSFVDSVAVGDTITLYRKTWVQLLSGIFGFGNVFLVEKNGIVLFDGIEGLRNRGIYPTIAFLIMVLCGLWFYSMEKKRKLLSRRE